MISLLETGKTIFSIDESSFNVDTMTRYSWVQKSGSKVKIKNQTANVTLISAINQHGEHYWAILRSNNDSSTFVAFLDMLALRLEE